MSSSPPPATPPPEALPDRERRNPWFRWAIHLGLPVGVSLAVHLTLFATMAFKTWQVFSGRAAVGEYEAGITQNTDNLGGGFRWPDANMDLPRDAEKSDMGEVFPDLRSLSDLQVNDVTTNKEPAGEGGGFGLGEGTHGGILGIGSGAGEAGTGGLGMGLGGRRGPGEAGVWNLRMAANKIVYVIDFSGSIVVAVDDLKRELKRSVGALKPVQSFDVVLFYSNPAQQKSVTESFAPTLQPATQDTKTKFLEWISRKAPQGDTEPLPAIQRAVALDPDVIFLLSDGLFEPGTEDRIKQMNRKNVKISCLVFDELILGDTSGLAPKLGEGALRLEKISKASGGGFKVVTARDLQR